MHPTGVQNLDGGQTGFTLAHAGATQRPGPLWLAKLFVISVVLPYLFQLGPMLLSVHRLMLLGAIIPCLVMWLSGRAGKILIADIALLLMCLWSFISYTVHHGISVGIETGGIYFVESMGAYLIARCCIRDADGFYQIVRLLFLVILAMLPFAIHETLTGQNLLLEWANKIYYAGHDVPKEPRWGFDRVQGVFPHPILFGIFCGSTPALVFYVLGYGSSTFARLGKTALALLAALLSLSSGPLTALIAQIFLISWDQALSMVKSRWKILSGSVLAMVTTIEIVANRSTPELFITYFAFNTWTAMNRIRIWEYGSLTVKTYPLFGVGLGDWIRPEWMSASMDMFWLVPAVRNGLPTALFLQLAFFALFLAVAFKPGLSERAAQYRTGYLICMMGFYLGGWTVHYWKAVYVIFIFLLGSGAWLLDAGGQRDQQDQDDPDGPHTGNPRKPVLRRANLTPGYTRNRGTIRRNRHDSQRKSLI